MKRKRNNYEPMSFRNRIWQLDSVLIDSYLVGEAGVAKDSLVLTVVLDAYSNCVVGCTLGDGKNRQTAIAALLRALL